MEHSKLLRRAKVALAEVFNERLHDVILDDFDSTANISPDAQIKMMVVLEGPLHEPADSWTCIDAVETLSAEIGREISTETIDAADHHVTRR